MKSLCDTIKERLGLELLEYPVPEHANTIAYSLGGMAMSAIVILFASGMLLAQFFVPDPGRANSSVHYLIDQVYLGWFLRGVHFWAAEVLSVVMLLHLLRAFFTGAHKAPREITWLTGVGLLALVTGLMFTGTVIKWDQEGYEALAHFLWVADKLGPLGQPLTESFAQGVPLIARLYMAHISLLPLLTAGAIGLHLFYVKYHKLSPLPEGTEAGEKTIPFTAHLAFLRRAGAGVFFIVCLLALLVAPPLGDAPVLGMEVTKPPWQFVWIFALENIWVPTLIIAPPLIFLALAAVPFADLGPERSWKKRPVITALMAMALLTLLALMLWGKFTTMTHSM